MIALFVHTKHLPVWLLSVAVVLLGGPACFGQATSEGPADFFPSSVAQPLPAEPRAADSLFKEPELATGEEPMPEELLPVNYDLAQEPDRITALEKKIKDLEKQVKANAPKKTPEFPSHKITGFMQLDTGYHHQDANNIATVGDAQDGTGFRRLRFAVQGKVAEFTNYQVEVDFATAGRPSFFDNYIDQGNLPVFGNIRVGHFLQPFSVDAMSGFRNLPFLERSLPFLAFVPFRRTGIMAYDKSESEMTAWGYSVYRTGGLNNAPLGDSRFASDWGDVGGYSFSTRATHLLWYDPLADDRYLWHVGGSYNFSELGANDAVGSGTTGNAGSPKPFYQSKVLPEFGPLGQSELSQSFGSAVNSTPIFVDTGRFQASNYNLFGAETVYQNGPLSAQAEWMGTSIQSVAGPVFYHGAYGEVMYRLTGEHRPYDKQFANLKNVVPFTDFIPLSRDGVAGWGAWEVAARWSYVDLRNPTFLDGHYYSSTTNTFTSSSHPGSGLLNDSTLGITWFLNKHTKLQGNWIHCFLDNQAKGRSDADLYVMRAQVDF
jgi:phosphate-selective porin OprO/OprP